MNSLVRTLLFAVVVACVGSSLAQLGGGGGGKNRGDKPRLLGGWSNRSPTEDDIKQQAQFFVQVFSRGNDLQYHLRLGNIVKAKSQVVAGTNYKITLVLEHTECAVGTNDVSVANCPTKESQRCTAKIYVRPWDNIRRVQGFECQ